MIQFSQQYEIISSVCMSYRAGEKVPGYLGDASGHKMFYKHEKYETWTLANFKFLVLWTVFEHFSNRHDTYKLLNELTDTEKKRIQKIKESCVLYKNTIKEDEDYLKTKIVTPALLFKMLKKDQISVWTAYRYLHGYSREGLLSRIQDKKHMQIIHFVQYFPVIQNYIDTKYP